jgi:hypothetical protein
MIKIYRWLVSVLVMGILDDQGMVVVIAWSRSGKPYVHSLQQTGSVPMLDPFD